MQCSWSWAVLCSLLASFDKTMWVNCISGVHGGGQVSLCAGFNRGLYIQRFCLPGLWSFSCNRDHTVKLHLMLFHVAPSFHPDDSFPDSQTGSTVPWWEHVRSPWLIIKKVHRNVGNVKHKKRREWIDLVIVYLFCVFLIKCLNLYISTHIVWSPGLSVCHLLLELLWLVKKQNAEYKDSAQLRETAESDGSSARPIWSDTFHHTFSQLVPCWWHLWSLVATACVCKIVVFNTSLCGVDRQILWCCQKCAGRAAHVDWQSLFTAVH